MIDTKPLARTAVQAMTNENGKADVSSAVKALADAHAANLIEKMTEGADLGETGTAK